MTIFSIDTNVLVYAADRAAGERHERALQIMDRAVRRHCVLTLQALAEFFYVTTRKRMVARAEAAAQLRDWTTEFPTVSADSEALRTALDFTVDRRFGWWDALLLATAERHGCEIVLSENMQDGARFGSVTILDPFVGDELPDPVAALLR
ncbi:MAG TPA: PIN domain-containing protein [Geminicoccaceae bacterium]